MDFSFVNVGIVISTYCIAELLKYFALKTDKGHALLPVLCIIVGALTACAILEFYPEGIPNCNNFVDAVGLGGMSGAASVGCNQIYKQYRKFSTGSNE